MIRGVIMDMDGTMFDTETVYGIGWHRVMAEHGLTLKPEYLAQIRGATAETNRAHFREWYGADVDYDGISHACFVFVQDYLHEHPIPLKPGLFELLDELKRRSIRVAVATATRRERAEFRWDKSGVTPYLDASVCGDEIPVGKPDPRIFLTAMERLGLPPEECLVLEDSFNGVRAGYASGARTVMIPDQDQPTPELRRLCYRVVGDLHAVIDIIREEEKGR